jgi:hypothetical protein
MRSSKFVEKEIKNPQMHYKTMSYVKRSSKFVKSVEAHLSGCFSANEHLSSHKVFH